MSGPCFGRVSTSPSLYHWKAFTNLGSLPQQIYRWPNWTKDGQLLNFRVVKHQRKKVQKRHVASFCIIIFQTQTFRARTRHLAHDRTWPMMKPVSPVTDFLCIWGLRTTTSLEGADLYRRWVKVGWYIQWPEKWSKCLPGGGFQRSVFFCQVKIGRRFPLAWLFFHMSSDQNPGYLLYIRDYTSQVYRDYIKPLYGSLWTNQKNGMSQTWVLKFLKWVSQPFGVQI